MAAPKLKPTNKVASPIRLAAAPAKPASAYLPTPAASKVTPPKPKPAAKPKAKPLTDSRLPVVKKAAPTAAQKLAGGSGPLAAIRGGVKGTPTTPKPKPAAPAAKPGLLDQIGSFFGNAINQVTGKKQTGISQAMKNPPQWYQKRK